MKIAVINETSAADRNADILSALEGRGCQVVNAGMTRNGTQPELQYIHTGLLAALLLNLRRVDFVVGGCGTGQGFLVSASQYPGVICGHILTPLDAWLFAQINGGNCISLALNQGYGWASDINLKFIFDRLFETDFGVGYPASRANPQRKSREMLAQISQTAHRPLGEIVLALPEDVLFPVLDYPGVLDLIDLPSIRENNIGKAIETRLASPHPM
jgi:ribose 5-phosphate isomerase RpiB